MKFFVNWNIFISIFFQSIDITPEGEEVRNIKILAYVKVIHKSLKKKNLYPPLYLRPGNLVFMFKFMLWGIEI